jgi:hypothetical protein
MIQGLGWENQEKLRPFIGKIFGFPRTLKHTYLSIPKPTVRVPSIPGIGKVPVLLLLD